MALMAQYGPVKHGNYLRDKAQGLVQYESAAAAAAVLDYTSKVPAQMRGHAPLFQYSTRQGITPRGEDGQVIASPEPIAATGSGQWFYLDASGAEQGPYPAKALCGWHDAGHMPASTSVRPAAGPYGQYTELGVEPSLGGVAREAKRAKVTKLEPPSSGEQRLVAGMGGRATPAAVAEQRERRDQLREKSVG